MTNAICTYDFTTYELDPVQIKNLLNEHCKKWDFQEEECPSTKRHHMQGRISLKIKKRINEAIKLFPNFHLSITSKENIGNNYYVTKQETRINGPWSSDDKPPPYIPRQIQEIQQLYPWQQQVVDSANIWDKRTINIIIDKEGNHGKSILCTYCGVHNIGRRVPFANSFKDIMRMIMDMPTSKLYLFDMPRALPKDKLADTFAAIEEIKNGHAFDDRYSFKEKYFDCPNIWVFMNKVPDTDYLSMDRWVMWQITEDNKLEEI